MHFEFCKTVVFKTPSEALRNKAANRCWTYSPSYSRTCLKSWRPSTIPRR